MTAPSLTGEPTSPGQIGLALRSVAAGILGGAGVTALVLHTVRGLQAQSPPPAAPVATGLVPNLILIGWLGGALVAAATAWWLMSQIQSSYRRGAFAMVASFATLAVALVTMPVDAMLGRPGLLAAGALGVAGAALLARSVRRRYS